MEKDFGKTITAIAPHPVRDDGVALGFVDGIIECYVFNVTDKQFTKVWTNSLKRGIRGLEFSETGEFLYAICANRAVCVFDGLLGNRLRSMKRGHEAKPTAISLVSGTGGDLNNLATGAESGEVFGSNSCLILNIN